MDYKRFYGLQKDRYRGSVQTGLLVVATLFASVLFMSVIIICMNWSVDSSRVVEDWPELPEKRLPQAIIIGARKSGTRALLKFLTTNPNIRPASREVHFFDRMRNYRLGLDWYRDQMPYSLRGQVTIEKSPAYFVTKGVPERIKAMNSSIKLILIVRNPVTRLISDFSQLLAHKAHRELAIGRDYDDYYHLVLSNEAAASEGEYSSFTDWRANMSDRLWRQAETNFEKYIRRADGGINEQRRAVRSSMYSNYLERWLSQFGRDQLHVVDGERLIRAPAEELRKVESFLGLDPVISEADFTYNQTKGFFCLSAVVPKTIARLRRETRQRACLGDDKGRRHVKVKRNLTDELQQFYSPYNDYLYSLVGRNFNWSGCEIK